MNETNQYATGSSHIYLDFDYAKGEHPELYDDELWKQIWNGCVKKGGCWVST